MELLICRCRMWGLIICRFVVESDFACSVGLILCAVPWGDVIPVGKPVCKVVGCIKNILCTASLHSPIWDIFYGNTIKYLNKSLLADPSLSVHCILFLRISWLFFVQMSAYLYKISTPPQKKNNNKKTKTNESCVVISVVLFHCLSSIQQVKINPLLLQFLVIISSKKETGILNDWFCIWSDSSLVMI